MKKTEERQSKSTYTAVVEMKCDLCGKTTSDSDWTEGKDYRVLETEVRLKDGTGYPEGGSGTETTIDICPDCFRSKLIPWVESQGGKPDTKDWDF